jgi:hypothetical protein
MKTVLEGAEGLKQAWLLDFAERAERCNIDKQTLTEFVNLTWESRND